MQVDWENLEVSLTTSDENEKLILNNLCGSAKPGELLAIMGQVQIDYLNA